MLTTLPQSVALVGDPAADLLAGRALGARYATPAVKPSDLARLASRHVADLAQHVAAASDYAHRPQHVQRALRVWGLACDAEMRAGHTLPPWPRWRGVERKPCELVAIVARVEGDAAAVVRLSEDIATWASAYDAQQEPGGEVGA